MKRFHGQVVMVTGASRGIGRGIADLFAREGAKLVLIGRDTEQLEVVKKGIEAKGLNSFLENYSNPLQSLRILINESTCLHAPQSRVVSV